MLALHLPTKALEKTPQHYAWLLPIPCIYFQSPPFSCSHFAEAVSHEAPEQHHPRFRCCLEFVAQPRGRLHGSAAPCLDSPAHFPQWHVPVDRPLEAVT